MQGDPPGRLAGDGIFRNPGCHVPHLQRGNPPAQSLRAIAERSHATDEDVEGALEEGFAQGVAQAMTDGIITRDEEERLRAFRDRLALESSSADRSELSELDRTGPGRTG